MGDIILVPHQYKDMVNDIFKYKLSLSMSKQILILAVYSMQEKIKKETSL